MKNIDLKDLFKKRNKIVEPGKAIAWPVHFVRDWRILVLIFAVGMISLSIFAWRIYLSNKIGGGYFAPVLDPVDTSATMIDSKRLDADLLILENKQIEFLKLKATQPKLLDPSI